MSTEFQDRVALVTGGASGIGKAVALALAARGARVGICDLNAAGAEAVAAEIGGGSLAIPMDVTDTPFLQRNIDEGHGKLMEAIVSATPLRRTSTPEEVAEAILFLASDRAAFTTGETLSVSGGLVMM